ncbi:hypothetical protein GCM10027176_45220 [Actinoallomurus bryophytorum]|uniref:Putative lipoprotein with Yx(FWY)xxD motif n=1 Tax=Actinoallomurus bryophytorum TaxID=1490222 RepID=A0A543CRQ1_9ACTN|nr:hypothetical protein [Actinoallomurus bryophytorum]TQL99597.1 putative lipoprotein with Yx(FWY)xxD motif [Actinoallomurus bryophytorum]
MRIRFLVLGAVLATGLAACGGGGGGHEPGGHAAPAGAGVTVSQSSLGPILTDRSGRTLYAFTNDKNGGSSCSGQCIASWPALVSGKAVTAGAGTQKALLGETKRAEGTLQATYGTWPLYYYAGDMNPGDVDGQGVDDVWYVVGADGKLIKRAS